MADPEDICESVMNVLDEMILDLPRHDAIETCEMVISEARVRITAMHEDEAREHG